MGTLKSSLFPKFPVVYLFRWQGRDVASNAITFFWGRIEKWRREDNIWEHSNGAVNALPSLDNNLELLHFSPCKSVAVESGLRQRFYKHILILGNISLFWQTAFGMCNVYTCMFLAVISVQIPLKKNKWEIKNTLLQTGKNKKCNTLKWKKTFWILQQKTTNPVNYSCWKAAKKWLYELRMLCIACF